MKTIFLKIIVVILVYNSCKAQNYPFAKKTNDQDTFFGKIVPNPYSWIENSNSEEVKKWVREENTYKENYFNQIPFRNNVKKQLEKKSEFGYFTPRRSGKYFVSAYRDPNDNSFIIEYSQTMAYDSWYQIDVSHYLKNDDNDIIYVDNYFFSDDSRYIAVLYNHNGSDWQEIRIIDIVESKVLPEHINNVRFSDFSWRGNGFYYSRYDTVNESLKYIEKAKYQHLYYHKLFNNSSKDSMVFKNNKDPYNTFFTKVSSDNRYLLITDFNQAKGICSYYYYDFEEKALPGLKPIIRNSKFSLRLMGHKGDTLFFENTAIKSARIVGIDLKNPKQWIEMIPKFSDAYYEDARYYNGKFFIIASQEAEEKLIVCDTKGNIIKVFAFPFGTDYSFRGIGFNNDAIYMSYTSCLLPPVMLSVNASNLKFDVVYQALNSINEEKYEIRKEWYQSDSAKVPLLIMCKKGTKLDASHPVFLEFYGGFGHSFHPDFDPGKIMFVEKGGVYAFAMIRGGGELGPKWHEAGWNLNKKNSVNDIIKGAEYLIEKKYTSSKLIAISGASQGGLMTAAAVVKRPDLFKVAIPVVGLNDLMHFEKYTAGPLFTSEYGSVSDSIQCLNLLSYSPIQNIKEKISYPSILIMTSEFDDRVPPMHSYKLAAVLQSLNVPNVILRVEAGAAHNGSFTYKKGINEMVDFYSFLFYNLGIKDF